MMIRNYLLTSFRAGWRQREYTLLNIAGLALGLACCIVIMLFVRNELSYDRMHANANRIFRVTQQLNDGTGWAWTGGAVPSIMKREFSHVQEAVSLLETTTYVSYENEKQDIVSFREENFMFADAGFFSLFNFPFAKGSAGTALREPYQIIITEAVAERYFGKEEPLGKTLKTTGDFSFTVTGVLKNLPQNSHIQFDFLTSMASFKATEGIPATQEFTSHWWPALWTYVLLDEPQSAQAVNAALPEIMTKHRDPQEVKQFRPALQALTDIHLHSQLSNEISPNGSITIVYVFVTIAVFTLVLACINFMNLATARAAKRAREIGVRKVTGAQRSQLMVQFFAESFVLNVAALLVALGLVQLALPLFNQLLGQQLTFSLTEGYWLWLILLGVLLLSSFLSGFYPALYLSAYRPIEVFKSMQLSLGGTQLRKGLVVFQFVLSITLVLCTVLAFRQVEFLRDANLGFDREHIVVLKMSNAAVRNYEVLQQQLLTAPLVTAVTSSSARPGLESGWGPTAEFEGSQNMERPYLMEQMVDDNFFDMMDIPLVAGRTFSENFSDEGEGELMRGMFPSATGRNFVVNKTAAAYMGKTPESIIGMPLRLYTEENGKLFSDSRGVVVGVVEDFHTSNLKNEIRPTVFSTSKTPFGRQMSYTLVKLSPGPIGEALAGIQKTWKKINPDTPLEYTFLDQDIENQYRQEQRLGAIVGVFAFLTLFIAMMGLFGLAAYAAEARTKEIGIRKVMGASSLIILQLLSKDFLKLVLIAAVLAWPLGYYMVQQWLRDFAFKTPVTLWPFVLSAGSALVVALITVSYHALKAAAVDPVKSLRYE